MMHHNNNNDDFKIADQVNLDMNDCTSYNYNNQTSSLKNDKNEELVLSKHSFNDFEYWNRSMSNMNCDINDLETKLDNNNAHLSTSSLSESLVNAYYSRKCLSNDFDNSSDDDSNKIDNTVTTTYLIWDFATNSFIEDKTKLNDLKSDESDNKQTNNVLLTSPNASTSNLITTTRFLHTNSPNNSNLTSFNQQTNINVSQTQTLTPSFNNITNKTKNELNSLSPSISVNSRSRNNSLSSNSSTSVVSKLKSWIGGGGGGSGSAGGSSSISSENNKKPQLSNNSDSIIKPTSSIVSNTLPFNPPLSVDLTRKLKRPTNLPPLLEYNNAKVFQGSLLEDWLMQTLDDYISNSLLNNNNNNTSLLTAAAANQIDITKSEHSLPGTFDGTPPASVRTSILIEVNDEDDLNTDSTKTNKNKLNSESYKAAIQSSHSNIYSSSDINDIQYNNNQNVFLSSSYIGGKRQEANFYVQQVLTDLIALGVLEYESGFENAINKTFKSKSDYVWGKQFVLDGKSYDKI